MNSEDHGAHVAAYWSYLSTKKYFTRDAQAQLIRAERNALNEGRMARRGVGPEFPWTGLALSGGGIRSATFSLGVLQALARNDILKHFDFISSVSGGGYIGASLQWWWTQGQNGVGPENFPYGPGSVGADQTPPFATKQQRSRLSFLRSHGKYLIPGQGINIWSALAVVLRTVLLSVVVWIPLLTLLTFLILLVDFHVVDKAINATSGRPETHPAISSPFASFFTGREVAKLDVDKPEVAKAEQPAAKTSPSANLGPSGADSTPAAPGIEAVKQKSDIVNENETAVDNGKTATAPAASPEPSSADATPATKGIEDAKHKSDIVNRSGTAANDGKRKDARLRQALAEALAPRTLFAVLHWLALLGAALFVVVALVFALLSGASEKPRPKGIGFWLLLALGVICLVIAGFLLSRKELADFVDMDWVLVVLFSLVGATIVGRSAVDSDPSGSYSLRRNLELWFGRWFLRWVVIAVLGIVPLLPLYAISASADKLGSSWHVVGAVLTILSGAISALYGYYLKLKNWMPGLAGQIFAPAGAAVFLLGTLTISYTLSIFAIASLTTDAKALADELADTRHLLQQIFPPVFILAILVGWLANLNHVGLHRFYRDRLMEVFMPRPAAVRQNRVSASTGADLLNVGDLKSSGGMAGQPRDLGRVPYPLVNAFAFLTDSSDGRVELRGGDNFLISPLYVGSRVTGWRKTNDYCDIHGPLTLATAMAVSGAAVNSNAGYIGTGLTRDRLVSAVMTILNMRLGAWIGNPKQARPGPRRSYVPTMLRRRKTPSYLFPMLTSGLFSVPTQDSRFIEVSDGGNFENLGIYELIRREVGVILVVDGEADPTLAFPALVSAINRVKEDFGATIRLSNLQGPDQLLPSASLTGYPEGAKFAQSPFMIGEISYAGSKKGVLIYIKATLIKELDFTTYGYRAGSTDFPHEGTEDQFFSEAQFEAYRNLGFVCAERMIAGTGIAKWINSDSHPPAQVAGL
ncbi:patatin-like phospholipase family protein [Bradyrhizobium sp. MOS002]|uniref:patatin-like phospholipase family protein n=1 Tax=Bradyrhizobium sp. MOS002 TaxID=2133947 RepID=UPI000D12C3BD|nr:patatin-like phospholipase family protein [Bradyrhizobium sp. MOS002]PSO26986.1 hypothetical protein C7G41_27655 [Bradyrhizobium sp. MOS002]